MNELSAVVLAIWIPALGGLGYVALKHPEDYQRIWGPIILGLMAVLMLSTTWFVAVNATISAIIRQLPANEIDKAFTAGQSMEPPSFCLYIPVITFVAMGILMYLFGHRSSGK